MNRPKIVCISGSMKFEEQMRAAAVDLSLEGAIVTGPFVNMKKSDPRWASDELADPIKVALDELHFCKIDLADEVVVVSDESGYFGSSTENEIAYAQEHGKPVRYLSVSLPYISEEEALTAERDAARRELERLTAEVALYRERDGLTRKALQHDGDGPLQFAALIVRQQRDKALAEVSRITAEVERLKEHNLQTARCVGEVVAGIAVERDEWRQAAGAEADLLDEANAEVSRLRDQLAAQPTPQMIAAKLREMNAADPDDDTMPVFWPLDDEHEGGIRHWTSVDKVAQELAGAWGVSSSEVEAPQPQEMEQHKVIVEPYRETMWDAYCVTLGCGQHRSGSLKQAQDWKDQHLADTLRPVLTNESFISSQDEGRPSGSGRLAPRSVEELVSRLRGLVFDLRDKPVESDHIDYDNGWRDGQIQAGNDLEALLDECAPDAAQAARSEATPKDSCSKCLFGEEHTDEDLAWHHGVEPVPSPSLRKEGEDSD